MRFYRGFAVAGLVLVGLVWIGQGSGVLSGSSFMVGDPFWALAGAVLVVAGIALGAVTVLRRPKA